MWNYSENDSLVRSNNPIPRGIIYFGCVYYFILIVAGTIGNILGIVVIRSSQVMKSSKGIFTALALADSLVLWFNPFRYWVLFVFEYDFRKMNTAMCKLQTFSSYASRDWATNVLCLLTFERFLFACFPHKSRIYWKKQRKITVWLIVFLIIISKNLPLLFKLDLLTKNSKTLCDTNDKAFRKVFFYADLSVYSIVPTGLLLIFNIGLLRVLHIAQRQRCGLMGIPGDMKRSNQPSTTKAVQQRPTVMDRTIHQANRLLIPVTIFHLATSLPYCVFSIIEAQYSLKQAQDSRTIQITFTLGYCFYMLSASGNGVNFLIYFLSSHVFRARLRNLVCHKGSPHIYNGGSNVTNFTQQPEEQISMLTKRTRVPISDIQSSSSLVKMDKSKRINAIK